MINRIICFLFGHDSLNLLRQLSAKKSWVECRRCKHTFLKDHK